MHSSTCSSPQAPTPGSLAAWLACIRPKTLGIASAPVAVGLTTSLAVTGQFHLCTALATWLLALLMQMISNMENDAGYTKRKAETGSRKGLPRATANGWLTVQAVERAIVTLACVALCDTLYLIWQGGWVMLAITAASIAAAYTYMGGKHPIAYTPWGETVVFVFFGPVAVCGTYWLQNQSLAWAPVLTGCALGLIAAAVLAVNNYRDQAHDAEVGRQTLAVVLGPARMRSLYAGILAAAYACVLVLALTHTTLAGVALVFVTAPRAKALCRDLAQKSGLELNTVMFGTVRLELAFALCLCLGCLIGWLL